MAWIERPGIPRLFYGDLAFIRYYLRDSLYYLVPDSLEGQDQLVHLVDEEPDSVLVAPSLRGLSGRLLSRCLVRALAPESEEESLSFLASLGDPPPLALEHLPFLESGYSCQNFPTSFDCSLFAEYQESISKVGVSWVNLDLALKFHYQFRESTALVLLEEQIRSGRFNFLLKCPSHPQALAIFCFSLPSHNG